MIKNEELITYAENAARAMKPINTAKGRGCAKELMGKLCEIRKIRDEQERCGDSGDSSREWLLDNYYIARREGIAAARELSRAGRLRSLADGKLLVCELAGSLVRSGEGAVDKRRCELFLTGFQKSRPMSLRELAVFPSALRLALIGELLRLCNELGDGKNDTAAGLERVFTSLRLMGTIDLSDVLEKVDQTEQILRQDPSGVYPAMDEKTRAEYRCRVATLARRMHTMEYRVARQAVKQAEGSQGRARHVGWHLFSAPETKGGSTTGTLYIAGNVLITLFFSLLGGFISGSWGVALLLLFPLSELVKNILDTVFLRTVKPRHIPRLELRGGVPDEGRTLCVIVSLLTDEQSGASLVRRMEEYRLANRDAGGNLSFGLLLDLPESKNAELEGAAAWLESTAKETERLNLKYGGGFFLLARERVLAERDGVYMGWERKRGALTELMKLLRSEESGVQVLAGESGALEDTRFVLTLDSDTRLGSGTARELIGAMLHPLVRPVIDTKRRIVTEGHGLIQPRMSCELESAGKTDFSRIYAGQGGTDPYGGAAGEVYMDSFGRGGFAGKGIIDVDAFMLCMDGRVAENTVLSHDTIEGAYLRGGYMGDVELTDGFPSGVRSYFRRLERWTRGDWQNSPWLFKKDMAEIERWRIFDSLRRSLVAPASLLALTLYFLFPQSLSLLPAAAAVVALASQLLLSVARGLARRQGSSGVRYHSSVVHGAGGALMRTVLRLLFLPYESWICLSAIITALWRMLVSRRKLLAWQTAAQTDRAKNTVTGSFLAMWQAALFGLLMMIFSSAIIGMAAGVIWLMSPAFAAALSRDKNHEILPTSDEREYLLGCAAEMWSYFEEHCTQENCFLPPDNFQDSPPVGQAHRSSPTNIGMCLLSILSAIRLEIASKDKGISLISSILDTIGRLEKWNGHLLNWYDTRDLSPLRPQYVSTVDSGNLAGCLIVLREGLTQLGEHELSERVGSILDPMDFSILYDSSRRLFRIGIDLATGEPTEGWYDLMSSEARLTGYIAIARGDIDRRHWRKLGRSQVQKDGYRGMVSWTGTMFEYLMPELILPVYRDSLLYESARFCIYAQKRRTRGSSRPWGISESAFFSLDQSLSYRYKAHGCASLALKRGQDSELVISPYSTFLTLTVQPKGAVKNLRRLESLGARGRFGFWEAVDFTSSRSPDGKGAVVRCVMAHHVGMSICAVADYLCNGYLQGLFMSDPAMAAHAGLLQERVPLGGVLLDSRERDVPEKPHHGRGAAWTQSGTGADLLRPKATLLSNGSYRLIATDSGLSLPRFGDILPYRSPQRQLDGSGLELSLIKAGERISLLPFMEPNDCRDTAWELSGSAASTSVLRSGVRAHCRAEVSASAAGELRKISLTPVSGDHPDCRLELRLEPVLAREGDYLSHPAFYRLGIEDRIVGNRLLLRRLARGSLAEQWLCIECDRSVDITREDSGHVILSSRLTLRDGLESVVSFAIAVGSTELGAKKAAAATLSMQPENAADLAGACAALLEMNAAETGAAMSAITSLIFPFTAENSAPPSSEGRGGLWRFGISGDFPIICAVMRSADRLSAAETLLKQHALLTTCGLDYDLAFLTGDAGDYRRPCATALWSILRSLDRESVVGDRAGVHFADLSADTGALLQSAAQVIDTELPPEAPPRSIDREYPHISGRRTKGSAPKLEHRPDGTVVFDTRGGLPSRSWSNMLTNGRFGYVATDCGTGHMWYMNAREYRVGRWCNDPYATTGTETLRLFSGGGRHSLFAEPGDSGCKISFSFGAASWEKTIGGNVVKTTAFVPMDVDARVFIIETTDPGARIAWQTELVLSGDDRDAVQVSAEFSGGMLRARNPRGAYPNAEIKALATTEPEIEAPDCGPCLSAVYPAAGITVLVCGTDDDETLRALTEPDNALKALESTRAYWHEVCTKISVNTPDEKLNSYLNGWAAYQALACRVMGRSSIYQSGGAFGFRDQLQDAVNLLPLLPDLTRSQIINTCAHQFEQGDVQHWWHPVDGPEKGVRTRCSDDLLWLPWAVCEYVEASGDKSILSDEVSFLSSPPLSDSEGDRYESPSVSAKPGTVLEHAKRALDCVIFRGTGEHGLLLIGTGDWNDGMDKIGAGGRGESVWLSWFFAHTARRFAGLTGDEGYTAAAEKIGVAANSAWDGEWYLRGYFDDGSPLGSSETMGGCRLDSIAQSFSVLCREAEPEKRRLAIRSAVEQLFDREHNIVKLFTPPFSDAPRDPGYIQSYGGGFRENGGQYTHGAIWLAMACLREGMVDEGYEILKALLPENHDLSVYQAEPYVIAADVYSAEGRVGEAGWSWYTGSAGWFLRVCLRELLGLREQNGELVVEPRLPSGWDGFEAVWNGKRIKATRKGVTIDES